MSLHGTPDTVALLNLLPQSSVGAPLPLVIATKGAVYVAYYCEMRDPNFDGSKVRVITPASEDTVAIVAFKRCSAHTFGPPNDEAFSGHPLAAKGLRPYGAFEVLRSSWIDRLETMNRVHHCHDRNRFLHGKRHFILTFHDSTFECVAHEVELVNSLDVSMQEAAKWMTRELLWVRPNGAH